MKRLFALFVLALSGAQIVIAQPLTMFQNSGKTVYQEDFEVHNFNSCRGTELYYSVFEKDGVLYIEFHSNDQQTVRSYFQLAQSGSFVMIFDFYPPVNNNEYSVPIDVYQPQMVAHKKFKIGIPLDRSTPWDSGVNYSQLMIYFCLEDPKISCGCLKRSATYGASCCDLPRMNTN